MMAAVIQSDYVITCLR